MLPKSVRADSSLSVTASRLFLVALGELLAADKTRTPMTLPEMPGGTRSEAS